MSAISSLAPSALGAPAQDAFSQLTSEEFVKIIFTELSKQDPLQPNDSKALLEQLSSLRNIQSGIDLSNKLSSLVSQNELSAASGLIGKTVSGTSDQFEEVHGVVNSVVRDRDGAVLMLSGGKRLRMSNLNEVLATAPATTPPNTGPATT